MSAENRVVTIPGQNRDTSKLPTLAEFKLHSLNGDKVKGVNGNGHTIDKANGKAIPLTEASAQPQALPDRLKRYGAMPARDFIKDGGTIQLFAVDFGATVSNYGKDIAFPHSDVVIGVITPEKGTAIMTLPNGDKRETKSLHSWAVRVQEDKDHNPELEFISPRRGDGSIEVVSFTKNSWKTEIAHRTIKEPATVKDGVRFSIAEELPRSESVRENPVRNSYKGAIIRDFPRTKQEQAASETEKRIQSIKQRIKDLRTDANADEIKKVINSTGPLSEEALSTVEEFAAARFADILREG